MSKSNTRKLFLFFFVVLSGFFVFTNKTYSQDCDWPCGDPRPAGCTNNCDCRPGGSAYGDGTSNRPACGSGTCTCCVCDGDDGPEDNYNAEGWLDVANCSVIQGWAGDADNGDKVVNVKLYADAGTPLPAAFATVAANSPAEQGVCDAIPGTNCYRCPANGVCPQTGYPDCATHGGCLHRFTVATPNSLKDGVAHTITAIGQNINSAGTETNAARNAQLSGSPKTVRCPNPPTALLSVMPATANDTLVAMPTAAPTTGGRLYEAPVGTNVQFIASASSTIVGNPKLSMVEVYLKNVGAGWTLVARRYCGGSLSSNGVCSGITVGGLNATVQSGTRVYVINAYNADSSNGNQCSGNPYITYPNPDATNPSWFDCNVTTNNPTATSDIVTIRGRPLYTLSGRIFQYDGAACTNTGTNVDDSGIAPNIANNAQVLINYTFNGVAKTVTHGNIFNSPTNYSVSIPETSRVTRITVGTSANPIKPALGEYRMACPVTSTNVLDLTATPIVMGGNRTRDIGFRLYNTTQWFTLLNSDMFANTAISDKVARTPNAPFSGYMIELTQNQTFGYAFSSSDLNDGSSNSRIVNRPNATRKGGFGEFIGTGVGNPFNFWDLALGSVNASSYPTLTSWANLQENTLYKLTNSTISATSYSVQNGGTAFVYYTGSSPLTFSGNSFTSTGGRVVLISLSNNVTLIPAGAATGVYTPNFSTTPQMDLAIVTPYNITVPGSGSAAINDDYTLALRGIYASNIFTNLRTRGFVDASGIGNENFPSLVVSYDPSYIYRMTRILRTNALSDIPGVTVFDISWPKGD